GTETTVTTGTDGNGVATADITNAVAEGITVTATPVSNATGAKTLGLTFTELAPVPMPSTTRIEVNGAEFGATDGFPKTGFVGARFQFAMGGNTANNSNYTWTVESGSWLSVDASGNVVFNSEGDGQAVILATPVAGGTPLSYTIDVDTWFINSEGTTMTAADADAWCSTQGGGYAIPSYTQMTNVTSIADSGGARAPAAPLWSEWGHMDKYGWSSNYWASEVSGSDRYYANLLVGRLYTTGNAMLSTDVACSKNI
ncbi:MAG: hypothetical protein ACK5NL_12285, partial [Vibrio fluvialis]